jgi:hypothetical protein
MEAAPGCISPAHAMHSESDNLWVGVCSRGW